MAGRLGDILIERGFVSEEQVEDALASRGMLGESLLSQGIITRQQLGDALSEQFEVPYENIIPEDIPAQMVRLIPEAFAKKRRLAPVRVRRGWMLLAMEAPDDMKRSPKSS